MITAFNIFNFAQNLKSHTWCGS